jgi:hypothetical protein
LIRHDFKSRDGLGDSILRFNQELFWSFLRLIFGQEIGRPTAEVMPIGTKNQTDSEHFWTTVLNDGGLNPPNIRPIASTQGIDGRIVIVALYQNFIVGVRVAFPHFHRSLSPLWS